MNFRDKPEVSYCKVGRAYVRVETWRRPAFVTPIMAISLLLMGVVGSLILSRLV